MEKSRKPKIRFKGFSDDWEQREFSGMFDCTISNNTLSRSELRYDEGSILNIHYGDILIKYGSILDIHKYEIPRIPNKKKEDFKGSLLQSGDIVIADTAEDETTGKACEIGSLFGNSIVAGLHTMVARPNIEMASGYLGYYLNSNAYHCQLLPMMQGIKVLSLSRANVKKTVLKFPESSKEQQLIANYFIQLDELITLHQRKLDKLINVKKSMLEKMFPKQGSTVPEVRFSGFTEDWEQRKLGDFGKATGGTSIESEFNEFGKYKVISIGSYSETSKYVDQGLRVNKTTKTESRILNKSDLTMILNDKTASGNIIGRILLIDADDSYVFNQRTERIEVYESEYLPEFLYQLMNADNIREKIVRASQGNTQIYVNWSSVSELTYEIPVLKNEQRKIADLFNQLDSLITLHQRKLEKLKNIKKSMLEKMFI